MSNDVMHVLEKYKNGSIETILKDPDQAAHDISILQNNLKDLESSAKNKVLLFLEDLLKVIEHKSDHLEIELKKQSETMQQIKIRSEAALSYIKPVQNKDKN